MNNGGIGRVIKINEGAPLRPAIKVLIDPNGTRYVKTANRRPDERKGSIYRKGDRSQ